MMTTRAEVLKVIDEIVTSRIGMHPEGDANVAQDFLAGIIWDLKAYQRETVGKPRKP